MVVLSSWKTLSRISWQPVQNVSVLVTSIAVLKPPQKIDAADEAADVRKPRLKWTLGRVTMRQ